MLRIERGNKVRFRNRISTLPQPNFDDSATKIRNSSAPKKAILQPKKKIPQPKKDDSATKTRRFRNQKQTIPQPKSAQFGNQNPCHFATKICASTLCMASPSATLNMASSSDAVGAAAFPPRHTCCHTQHGIVFRCGGVGWDNNVLAAAFLPLTHLRPHSTRHRLQMRDLCARRQNV